MLRPWRSASFRLNAFLSEHPESGVLCVYLARSSWAASRALWRGPALFKARALPARPLWAGAARALLKARAPPARRPVLAHSGRNCRRRAARASGIMILVLWRHRDLTPAASSQVAARAAPLRPLPVADCAVN